MINNLKRPMSSRNKHLTNVVISAMFCVLIGFSASGQDASAGQATYYVALKSNNVLASMSQNALQRKAAKAEKNKEYTKALEIAILGLQTKRRVRTEDTQRLSELITRVYPLMLDWWRNELSSLGQGVQSLKSPDRVVSFRRHQVQLYQQQINLHNLMKGLPDGRAPDFLVDLLALEAERDVYKVLLQQSLALANDWHFEHALRKLLDQTKQPIRESFGNYLKNEPHHSPKNLGNDSQPTNLIGFVSKTIVTTTNPIPLVQEAFMLAEFNVCLQTNYAHSFIGRVISSLWEVPGSKINNHLK